MEEIIYDTQCIAVQICYHYTRKNTGQNISYHNFQTWKDAKVWLIDKFKEKHKFNAYDYLTVNGQLIRCDSVLEAIEEWGI